MIARGIGREAIHAHSSPWARTHHDFIEVLVWAVAAGGPEDSPATLVNEGDSRRGQLLPCMNTPTPTHPTHTHTHTHRHRYTHAHMETAVGVSSCHTCMCTVHMDV